VNEKDKAMLLDTLDALIESQWQTIQALLQFKRYLENNK
jgi:hypothetical protein